MHLITISYSIPPHHQHYHLIISTTTSITTSSSPLHLIISTITSSSPLPPHHHHYHLHYHLITKPHPPSRSPPQTLSEYREWYEAEASRRGLGRSYYSEPCFDATWVYALALNRTIKGKWVWHINTLHADVPT